MASLEIEMKRAKAQGDRPAKGFSGAVRSLENPGLEAGDKFTFPDEYKVFKTTIGENEAEYIFVDVNGNTKKFFPSTFTKSRSVVDEDGTLTGERAHTEGTAAELYRSAGTVKEGMDLLKGKTVEVTDLAAVRVLRFGTEQVTTTYIPTIDLVD